MNYDDLPTDDYSHLTGAWQWHGSECKGADEKSFVPHNNVWATDKNGLFKQDTRVRVKDPASCRVLNLLFAKDDYQVYYIMGVAKAVVDVESFEVLDAGYYSTLDPDNPSTENFHRRFGFAHDKKNVYCHDFFSGAPKVLKGADRNNFRRLEYGFARDDKHVWCESSRINSADPNTFVVIDRLYSKDQRHVYYWEAHLEAADPQSFEVIAETTGIDAAHVYFQRALLPGADPSTFGMDPTPSWVGRDLTKVFLGSHLVVGADPDSFERIGNSNYYRDKHTVYFHHVPVVDVDRDSFEVIGTSWGHAKDKFREYNDGILVPKT